MVLDDAATMTNARCIHFVRHECWDVAHGYAFSRNEWGKGRGATFQSTSKTQSEPSRSMHKSLKQQF